MLCPKILWRFAFKSWDLIAFLRIDLFIISGKLRSLDFLEVRFDPNRVFLDHDSILRYIHFVNR